MLFKNIQGVIGLNLYEKTNILRYPDPKRKELESNIRMAINSADEYLENIYLVYAGTYDYFQGIDFYVVTEERIIPIRIIDEFENYYQNFALRGIETIKIKRSFFPDQIRGKILRKITQLASNGLLD